MTEAWWIGRAYTEVCFMKYDWIVEKIVNFIKDSINDILFIYLNVTYL